MPELLSIVNNLTSKWFFCSSMIEKNAWMVICSLQLTEFSYFLRCDLITTLACESSSSVDLFWESLPYFFFHGLEQSHVFVCDVALNILGRGCDTSWHYSHWICESSLQIYAPVRFVNISSEVRCMKMRLSSWHSSSWKGKLHYILVMIKYYSNLISGGIKMFWLSFWHWHSSAYQLNTAASANEPSEVDFVSYVSLDSFCLHLRWIILTWKTWEGCFLAWLSVIHLKSIWFNYKVGTRIT